jgi:hypothetical protein
MKEKKSFLINIPFMSLLFLLWSHQCEFPDSIYLSALLELKFIVTIVPRAFAINFRLLSLMFFGTLFSKPSPKIIFVYSSFW